MIRSGSTLQYQLACAILATAGPVRKLGFIQPGGSLPADWSVGPGVAVCKLHHHDAAIADLLRDGQAAGFYCFRDLRDVAKSSMQVFGVPFDQLWKENWLQGAIADGGKWLSLPNVYSTKYPFLVENIEHEILLMAEWLGVPLNPKKVAAFGAEYSHTKQQERLKHLRIDGGKGFDPESLLHPKHLREPEAPEDASSLSEAQTTLILESFSDWMDLHGFTVHSSAVAIDDPGKAQSPVGETYVTHCGWMRHPPGDEVAQLLREGHYELDLQAFFWLYLRPGDRFIDVGAHFGLYSQLAQQVIAPQGQILTIEPNPASQSYLRDNLAAAPLNKILPFALGRNEGTARLAVGSAGFSAHSYVAAEPTHEFTVEVPIKTLQAVLTQAGWDQAQLVKIDTEGREFDILEGAGKLLGTSSLPILSLEFSERNLLSFGRTTRQLAQVLQRRGYQLCRFDLTTLQLVPVPSDVWPIWYENYFAVLNMAAVNARLRETRSENRRIAEDIAAKAAATSRWGELAELETYREQASQVASIRAWAEHTEKLLQDERKVSASHKAWAERTEALLQAIREEADNSKAWAERTEALLRTARQEAADHLGWAQRTERLLVEARAGASHPISPPTDSSDSAAG